MNVYADSTGHFVDRAVGKVTDLETGDKVADAVASAVEFVALIGIFAIPILFPSWFGAEETSCFRCRWRRRSPWSSLVSKHRGLGSAPKHGARQVADTSRRLG